MNLYEFIKYFILGGVITIFGTYLVEKYEYAPALSAYLYCTPTVILLIMYIIYKNRGLKGYYIFIIHSLINCAAVIIFFLALMFLTKYTSNTIYQNILLGSLLYICYSIYYFFYIYKLQFTP